jgi:hypothetical protein
MSATAYTVKNTKDLDKDMDMGINTILPISRTDGKKGKSGLCIVAPCVSDAVLSLVSVNPIGKQFLINALDDLRSRMASAINKNGGMITSDRIGIDAMIATMSKENESQRFTKESIAVWFAEYLEPVLCDRIKNRNSGIAADKLDKAVAGYLVSFQILANKPDNRNMSKEIRAQLLTALSLLPEDHDTVTAEEIAARLEVVSEASASLLAL